MVCYILNYSLSSISVNLKEILYLYFAEIQEKEDVVFK